MTMDFELRLKALSRLAESTTADARSALLREISKASSLLRTERQYDTLEQQLKIFAVIGHGASREVVASVREFIDRVSTLEIAYPENLGLFGEDIKTYRNASSLTVEAIGVLSRLRYLETSEVVRLLMALSLHDSEEVRKKAQTELEGVASYKITVIYGDGKQRGIGFAPQVRILDELSKLDDVDFQRYWRAIRTLANGLLSMTMEQTSWTYKDVSFTRGELPVLPALAEIRQRSIECLKRLYFLVSHVDEKLAVLAALSAATRGHDAGRGSDGVVDIIARNSIAVLDFLLSLVAREDFAIIQRIEHQSFWIFYHAVSPAVATAALQIEAAISQDEEYRIYKTLIGFEGVFRDWRAVKDDRTSPPGNEAYRREKALEFVKGMTPDNHEEWRRRIFKFAETQSNDLATFPVFYYFLEQVGFMQPRFALGLLRDHTKDFERFLIPLLRSLSSGSEEVATKELIRGWMRSGRHLYSAIKQYLSNEKLDVVLLKELLQKAIELRNLNCVALVISVAISNYDDAKRSLIADFFLPALRHLTEHANADWVFDAWFRQEAASLIRDLAPAETSLVLENLLCLEKIDFESEEVLYLVAKREPEKVVKFFCDRLAKEARSGGRAALRYDAVPFEMQKLKEPLSGIPRLAIQAVRRTYDGNYGFFILRGAKLLHVIFPEFPEAFETELLRVLEGKNEGDIAFVLAVLRNYEGVLAIHRVCKEVVRILPRHSTLLREIMVVLESTGMVSGEFGFAEAYEQKKLEIKDWLEDSDDKIKEFAREYTAVLDAMIAAERKRAEEDIALRKHKYGA